MSRGRERKRGQRGLAILIVGGLVLIGPVAGSIAAAEEEEPTKEALKALVDAACNRNNWRQSEEAAKALSRLGPRAAPVLPELLDHYLGSPTYQFAETMFAIGEPAAAHFAAYLQKRAEYEFPSILQLLRDMGPKAVVAVPTLAWLLKREGRAAREGILRALAAIGPGAKEALPALLDVLGDQDWMVQEQANYALAVLGPVAIPALVDRLAWEEPTSRARAARVLGTMGPGAWPAVLALREALGDPDPHVRVQAAQALVAIDDDVERALPVILAAFPSLTEEHYGLVEWPDRLGPRAARTVPTLIRLLDASPAVRSVTIRALAKIDPEAKTAAPVLAAALDKNPNDLEAALALWSIDRRPEATRILLTRLESSDEATRNRALDALGSICPHPPEMLPILVKLLSRREEHSRVIPLLSDFGPAAKEAEPLLEELLRLPLKPPPPRLEEVRRPSSRSHTSWQATWISPRKRLDVAHALWRIQGDAQWVLSVLMDVLDSKGLWEHKERSLFDGEEMFFGKAWWPTPWDVSRAASILGEMGPAAKEAAPLLREALSATNRSIRTSAAEALWRIEGDAQATVREFLQISAEEFPPFSRSGSFGLGGRWAEPSTDPLAEAGAQAVSLLIDALDRPEPQVRARAAGALGGGGSAASEVLSALSRAARDPDVRVASAAIGSLRQLGPEGRKALERALPTAEMLPPRKRR